MQIEEKNQWNNKFHEFYPFFRGRGGYCNHSNNFQSDVAWSFPSGPKLESRKGSHSSEFETQGRITLHLWTHEKRLNEPQSDKCDFSFLN